ncbi:MAG: DUF445 family protein [Deferribacterota bacterium]|nr:DUF445 family protein [Deferribacterota bacterium]
MLFRPFKRRWFTLGWQGVIPRNRSKLASEIGLMVGNKLISNEAIKGAIWESNFQDLLEVTIKKELKNILDRDVGNIKALLNNFGIDSKNISRKIAEYLIESEGLKNTLNEKVNNILENLLEEVYEKKISDYPKIYEGVITTLHNLILNYLITNEFIDKLSNDIGEIILSGKSLKNIIKIDIDEILKNISNSITVKLTESIYNILQRDEVKEKITRKIIDFKNNYFKDGFFNQLKLTAINIILSDETIYEIIDKEFPQIVNSLKNNNDLKNKISDNLYNYLNNILSKPIYEYIERIGFEKFYEYRAKIIHRLKKYIHSDNFNEKIENIIKNNIETLSQKKIKEVLKNITINNEKFSIQVDVSNILKTENQSKIENLFNEVLDTIVLGNIYNSISEKTYNELAGNFKKELNSILDNNIINVFNTINISKIITDKINNLSLKDVENLLFSFMKEEFRWINLLGFIIGFIIGVIEVIIIQFY